MTGYQLAYNQVINKLKSARRKETGYLFTAGILNSLSITILLVLFVSLLEYFANGDETFRAILAATLPATFSFFALLFTYPATNRLMHGKYYQSKEDIALRVGNKYPELKDKLCNAIQLITGLNTPKGTSGELAVAAFNNVSVIAGKKDFNVIIDRKKINRAIILFIASGILALAVFVIFNNSMSPALNRVINWNRSYLPPAPFSLSIEPINGTVLRNETAIIQVNAEGTAPEKIALYLREEQQEVFDKYELSPDTEGNFKYEIPSLKNTIYFYAEASWLSSAIRTKEGKISVIERPLIKSMNGKLILPGYTGMASRNFDERSGDLTGLAGSNVKIDILSNKQLDSAFIVIEKSTGQVEDSTLNVTDTTFIDMVVDGDKASGSFRIRYSGTYHIIIKDKEGLQNTEPIRYSIVAMYDDYPSITMLEPVSDVQIGEDGLIFLKTSISDDYGFTALKLHYRLAESEFTSASEKFSSIKIPLPYEDLAMEVPYLWNLNDIGISPSDKYEYYLEIFDNDRVSGPKSAKTQILTLRLPSLDEVLAEANKEQDKVEKDMKKTLKETKKIQKDLEQLNRDLLKNQKKKELDWKEKKKVEDIMKRQDDISEKLKQMQKNLNDVTKNLQKNNAISQETLQKYMELQKLMKEVNSPEMRKMSEQIKNAMDKMTPQEMQKAMEKFAFNEEQLKKSIERTMKLLQRMKAEQKADALTKRAEELLKNQEKLQKETENANPNDQSKRNELANKQDKLSKDLDKIGQEMKELEDLMKEIGSNMPMDEMKDAKDALKKQETSQEMQQSQQQMQQGDFNKSSQNQENAKQNLNNFISQMQKMKEKMNNSAEQEAMRQMQKSISDMLELSQGQEDLMKKTKSTEYNSTQYPELSKKQAQLQEALSNTANSMMDLAEKSFAVTPQMGKEIGQAMGQMHEASRNLTDRNTHRASQLQQQAMASMNNAIAQMQSMMAQMQSQGNCKNGSCPNPGGQGQGQGQGQGNMPDPNGMGFAERLQQAAALQQQVQQGLQQMGQGGKLNQEQQAELGRLASQQGNAMKSVEELSMEHKKFSPGDKLPGELNKLSQDMKELMSDIESGNITPNTLKRQERIMSRLLDAVKSVHDRDFEKQRKSRSGKDVNRNSPGAIDLSTQEGRDRAYRELLNSIKQGYTKDFENLIRKYFEKIHNE